MHTHFICVIQKKKEIHCVYIKAKCQVFYMATTKQKKKKKQIKVHEYFIIGSSDIISERH